MSIVNLVTNELPKEGSVVYCDNVEFSSDRAVFKNGKFIGGGEYPCREYEMTKVTKWFYLDLYSNHHSEHGETSYFITFDVAENINPTVKL